MAYSSCILCHAFRNDLPTVADATFWWKGAVDVPLLFFSIFTIFDIFDILCSRDVKAI